MAIRLSIIFSLVFLFNCSKKEESKVALTYKDAVCAEQSAVDYFIHELINKDSLFYVVGDDGLYFEVAPQTFLEDSLFVDGLFFWKKIYATNKVKGLTRPFHTSKELKIFGSKPDEIQKAKEFEKDLEDKKKTELPLIKVEFPPTISIIESSKIKGIHLVNSLFLETKHHLESSDQYLVEISVYNLEYDEYKSILFYMDKNCKVLDWKM
ncbi:hypothetical protein C900_00671 [Fulvivirga imtechensis AK7]|uniref:Uncharacterized protein n=1 Tax=Fulvivirga imtechensis AK7 TaxID=1237149 RepID=L8JH55_9BACT|nr:hypothetical protein [Fulvivirga imtechensis]ELR68196.1 hypothetical protein C900_00671 [Fulvivirga imtechensis AK7]